MTTDNIQPTTGEAVQEPKKVNLGDAMKQMLAKKKQAQQESNGQQTHHSTATQKMRSQINKKPNNQKKRMGV